MTPAEELAGGFVGGVLLALGAWTMYRAIGPAMTGGLGPWQMISVWRVVERRNVDGKSWVFARCGRRPIVALFWEDGQWLYYPSGDQTSIRLDRAIEGDWRRRQRMKLVEHVQPPKQSDDPEVNGLLARLQEQRDGGEE